MNIPEDKLKLLIREALLKEVTELITMSGGTSFKTARYEECPQIKVPPIFKDLFIDKVFGETPNEIRANLKKKYEDLEANEQRALLFNEAFSDENLTLINDYLTQFLNMVGVPAMFCKLLQLAIDKAAGIIELFYDRIDEEPPLGEIDKLFSLIVVQAIVAASDENFNNMIPDSSSTLPDKMQYRLNLFVADDLYLRSRAKSTIFYYVLPSLSNDLVTKIDLSNPAKPFYNDPAGSGDDLQITYSSDVVEWDQIMQSMLNNDIADSIPQSGQIVETILSSLVNSSSLIPTKIRDIVLNVPDIPQLVQLNRKLYNLGKDEFKNQIRVIQNLFVNTLGKLLTASQNHFLYDLPRLHKDITKLGKNQFYKEDKVQASLIAIARNIQ